MRSVLTLNRSKDAKKEASRSSSVKQKAANKRSEGSVDPPLCMHTRARTIDSLSLYLSVYLARSPARSLGCMHMHACNAQVSPVSDDQDHKGDVVLPASEACLGFRV